MLAILIAGIKFLQGCIPIAMGDARDAMRHIWLQGSALDKCLLQSLVVYLLEVDALGTASDGLQEEFRFLAHHDEEGLRRRFLQEFQYLVGTRQVHTLGKPDKAHLVAAHHRLEVELVRDVVGFLCRDDGLLVEVGVGLADAFHPFVYLEVGTLGKHLSPLGGEVIAHRLVVARHIRSLDGGVGEVEVGMFPLLEHRLGSALFIGEGFPRCQVGFVTLAHQITGKSQCRRHLAASPRTAE